MQRPEGWRAPGSGVGHPHNGHRRAENRNLAEKRQAERDARTPEQQIALARTRRGESKREIARLLAQIEAAKRKPQPKVKPSRA